MANPRHRIQGAGYAFPVERSSLTTGAGLLPTEAELKGYLGRSA